MSWTVYASMNLPIPLRPHTPPSPTVPMLENSSAAPNMGAFPYPAALRCNLSFLFGSYEASLASHAPMKPFLSLLRLHRPFKFLLPHPPLFLLRPFERHMPLLPIRP